MLAPRLARFSALSLSPLLALFLTAAPGAFSATGGAAMAHDVTDRCPAPVTVWLRYRDMGGSRTLREEIALQPGDETYATTGRQAIQMYAEDRAGTWHGDIPVYLDSFRTERHFLEYGFDADDYTLRLTCDDVAAPPTERAQIRLQNICERSDYFAIVRYHDPQNGERVTHAWATLGEFELAYLGLTDRDYYDLYAETDPISHSITSDVSPTLIEGNAQMVEVDGKTYGMREMRAEGVLQKLACNL